MDTALSTLRVIHIVAAILMAWPFYALVAVNQRARLGPPLGDRVDTFLENTVKRCRERDIIIPTYAQMKDPSKIPAKVKDELKNIGLWDIHRPYRRNLPFL